MSEFFSKTGKPRSGLGHAKGFGMGEGYGGEGVSFRQPVDVQGGRVVAEDVEVVLVEQGAGGPGHGKAVEFGAGGGVE
jgi:hypothetical protein